MPPATAPAAASVAAPVAPAVTVSTVKPTGPVTLSQVQNAWQEVLGLLEKRDRNAWIAVFSALVVDYRDDDVLVLEFPGATEVTLFRSGAPGKTPSDSLRSAIADVLGARVKYIARVAETPSQPPAARTSSAAPTPAGSPAPANSPVFANSPAPANTPAPPPVNKPTAARSPAARSPEARPPIAAASRPAAAAATQPATTPARPAAAPATRGVTWETVQIPSDEPPPLDDTDAPAEWEPEFELSDPVEQLATHTRDGAERYGEAVVREMLNATFIEEVQLAIPDEPRRIGEE